MDQLEPLLGAIRERHQEQAAHLHGLECLVGFLLAQLKASPGWSAERLLDALEAEQRAQLERDPEAPQLWPFEQLAMQLSCLAGRPVWPSDLPKALQRGFPRLDSAPLGLRLAGADIQPDE